MSNKFNTLKEFFKSGLWSEKKLQNAVKKNFITPDEYKSITGKSFNQD